MDYSIFDNTIDAAFIFDESKKLVYCNQASATILGTSLKRIKYDKSVYDYITFDDSTLFCMPNGINGKSEFTPYKEMNFVTSKGNQGTGLVTVSPLGGNTNHWVVFIKDMTVEIQLQRKYKAQLEQKENVIVQLEKAKEELKKYSENLELMVQDRTRELSDANRFINTMINSLGQGLMVFTKNNTCLPIYTKACEKIYGKSPSNLPVWEVFNITNPADIETIKTWTACLFEEILPFQDTVGIGPSELKIDSRNISLNYYPMKNADGAMEGVVAVATDVTQEVLMKEKAKMVEMFAQMVMKIVKNKDQFVTFVKDSRPMLERLIEKIKTMPDTEAFHLTNRVLHTIKGGASLFSAAQLADLAHHYEDELLEFKRKSEGLSDKDIAREFSQISPQLLKNLDKLKTTMEKFFHECKEFVGESIVDGEPRVEIPLNQLDQFKNKITTKDLQNEFINSFIKRPIHIYFSVYNELVQELAERQGKKIGPIQFTGEDIKVDPFAYTELFNSLVHAFRNAVDHGIETTDEREEKGRPPIAEIRVTFSQADGLLNIKIQDDGRGIDPERIRAKLKEKNFPKSLTDLPDDKIIYAVFEKGFSTSEAITDVSGRGIGMDAIKFEVDKLKGKILLNSQIGIGTALTIQVPIY